MHEPETTALLTRLAGFDRVVVAFSGGADSAFVLAAAVRALGPDRVVAATADSASMPRAELALAADFARDLGVRHELPATREMELAGYRENSGNRCYFCKTSLMDALVPLAEQLGGTVLTGTNADDAKAGFRPGISAADERGAVAPLRDGGFTKAMVREVSQAWGLRTWDKPAAACLSSRIAYGVEVTPSGLARVERAETSLRLALAAAGHVVRDLRVRDMGRGVARVDVDGELVGVAGEFAYVVEGFDRVDVNPEGFRSGSLNDLLQNLPSPS